MSQDQLGWCKRKFLFLKGRAGFWRGLKSLTRFHKQRPPEHQTHGPDGIVCLISRIPHRKPQPAFHDDQPSKLSSSKIASGWHGSIEAQSTMVKKWGVDHQPCEEVPTIMRVFQQHARNLFSRSSALFLHSVPKGRTDNDVVARKVCRPASSIIDQLNPIDTMETIDDTIEAPDHESQHKVHYSEPNPRLLAHDPLEKDRPG
ncbi:hypothetical protein V8F33_011539 [Rhypophila sp. PSN 637]